MAKVPVPAPDYYRDIPTHSIAPPLEADVPIQHYERSANDAWNLLLYVERNLNRTNVYQGALDRHLHRLQTMVLLSLVEAFERFLKELAAVCIDQVAELIFDDRLDVFTLKGQTAAAHFSEGSVGKALCESSTWLDCEEISKRFRRILALPNDPNKGSFYLFPGRSQQPPALRDRAETVEIIFQLRHTIVHNAAVITKSDAIKLSRLTKRQIESPRIFWPERADVWYVKLFLDDTANTMNQEVGKALADLLTVVHQSDPAVFTLADKAQRLADLLQIAITINQVSRHPMPT